MTAKRDIADNNDIDRLVRAFYERVRPDPLIGHFFVDLDWDHHIPRITAFWNMILLGDRSYEGDPMTAHILLSRQQPMHAQHFERWLAHWDTNADALFAGPKTEEAKSRARTIAGLMAHKVGSR